MFESPRNPASGMNFPPTCSFLFTSASFLQYKQWESSDQLDPSNVRCNFKLGHYLKLKHMWQRNLHCATERQVCTIHLEVLSAFCVLGFRIRQWVK